ncbi:heterokaryon incompatibility protein-domain-containing protein [Xylaria grammica]|nr:heterokaryon incompatibility protein-domain-containing protein [Xylaria grammica]
MPQFKYNKINGIPGGDRIRILSLAASGTFTDPIQVSISVVNLESSPTYEALSYYWGEASDKRLIFCNGKPFPVTQSLESALRHLRRRKDDRVLWIDAICINQEDVDERAHQVNLMRHIYQNAHRVVAWLGESSDDSDRAFQFCERMIKIWGDVLAEHLYDVFNVDFLRRNDKKRIMEEMLTHIKSRKATTRRQSHQSPESASIASYDDQVDNGVNLSDAGGNQGGEGGGMHYPTKEEEMAIFKLASRPWFLRCWVLQEVSLAREAIALCGTDSISWESLFWGYILAIMLGDGHGPAEAYWRTNLTVTTLLGNKLVRERASPVLVLWSVRWLDVTDPRDKVYSVLGLIGPKEARIEGLTADYTISVEECYKRAALAILSHMRNLDLLMTERNLESKLDLPSWVPDWERKSLYPFPLFRDFDPLHLEPPEFKMFRASTSEKWNLAGEADGNVLRLSGYVFDKIIALECVLAQNLHNKNLLNISSMGDIKRFWEIAICGMGAYLDGLVEWDNLAFCQRYSKYPTGEDPESVFAITLCAGYTEGPEIALTGFRVLRQALLCGAKAVTFLRRFGANSQVYKAIVFLAAMFTLMFTLAKVEAATIFSAGTIAYWSNVLEATLFRRLARTEKGYLAIVPGQSAIGDHISLFQGGKMPFVTRSTPQKNRYNLLGPCYVHGIMYGEAWNPALARDTEIV